MKTMTYSYELSTFGFFMGGWIGYLFRPSLKVLGTEFQLPFSTFVDMLFGDTRSLKPVDQKIAEFLLWPTIEYIITGLILGAVIGWAVGKLIKR